MKSNSAIEHEQRYPGLEQVARGDEWTEWTYPGKRRHEAIMRLQEGSQDDIGTRIQQLYDSNPMHALCVTFALEGVTMPQLHQALAQLPSLPDPFKIHVRNTFADVLYRKARKEGRA